MSAFILLVGIFIIILAVSSALAEVQCFASSLIIVT